VLELLDQVLLLDILQVEEVDIQDLQALQGNHGQVVLVEVDMVGQVDLFLLQAKQILEVALVQTVDLVDQELLLLDTNISNNDIFTNNKKMYIRRILWHISQN
jgi:hypothetical protein